MNRRFENTEDNGSIFTKIFSTIILIGALIVFFAIIFCLVVPIPVP